MRSSHTLIFESQRIKDAVLNNHQKAMKRKFRFIKPYLDFKKPDFQAK